MEKYKRSKKGIWAFVPMGIILVFFMGTQCFGATVDVYLQASVTTIPINTMNNPEAITMWGYALCSDNTFTICGPVMVPGPPLPPPNLRLTEGDTLNIHLRNNLSGPITEPTSIVIPGQNPTLAQKIPTWTDGTTGPRANPGQRVRSFVTETPVGATTIYIWPSLKAGTYIYQTGTHPAVQGQMGLYGALRVLPATLGQAYNDPSTAYNIEAALLYSEIDPELHFSIASGRYGTPQPAPPSPPVRGNMTSPVNYLPRYFLINGKPYANAPQVVPAGKPGQKVLLRFLNAGLLEKTATLFNSYETIIAEDGNLLPYSKQQYSALLPAGKTLDSLFTTTIAGKIALFDRSLNLGNGPVSPGGMLTYLNTQRPTMIDFDGDGKTDIAIYRPSNGGWYIMPSAGGAPTGVGLGGGPSDIPVPGDYDGDGKTDVAIYRISSGAWAIIPSSTGISYTSMFGGDPSDKPVPGDYDGDGKSDVAVYRTSTGAWYVMPSSGAAPYGLLFGADPSDKPVPGDYDGDGKADIAVYRWSTGAWYVIPSSTGIAYGTMFGGDPSDIPVPGDYDGDGKTDIAVYRLSTGAWFITPSSNGLAYGVAWGGDPSDKPVPGDYDGDVKTDIAVYRTSTGAWYINPSSGAAPYGLGWGGGANDIPVKALY